ncbi:transcription factor SPT20 homolog [Drosophila rhopaloa]|uniref:Transcription factor SPT20 homolog n=1 Tax=Drosophila rhopaloa TaxID=1041015 RepID=A0A6P4EER1_DRORH|nr:transcription factor SPT20 homolog [Drosophila rhopaloa]
MVVSESESEFLFSGPQPMSEHQEAIDGNLESLLVTPVIECVVELNPGSPNKHKDTNKEEENPDSADPKDLEENQTDTSSPTREDTTRPLVLEERHSLSIAETKKRRASVYSNELLFIPKELARSELQQRTRIRSRYAKNRDYHLRMLKFPVGSGRPRFVAKQMKKGQEDNQPISKDSEDETNDCLAEVKQEEFIEEPTEGLESAKELPMNMPDLRAESKVKHQLPDDEEISIMLYDLVKKEVDDNNDLEKMNRQILQSQRQSVIRSSSTKLQHYPYLRWHNPDRVDQDFKMGLLEQRKTKWEPEIQVGYCKVNNVDATECIREEDQGEYTQELAIPDPQVEQPSVLEPPLQQTQAISCHEIPAPEQVIEVPVNDFTPAISGSPGDSEQTTNSALRQQLMHHIVQPNLCNEEVCQSISCNNNAIDLVNQNLRQHQFAETSIANDLSHQWNPQNSENFIDQSFHKQQLHIQQQYLYQQLNQAQNQQQQEIIYQQHQHEAEDKLQQMRAMYQRIKSREEEQLRLMGKSLKKLLDERLNCERKHAEEKRLFLLKMEHIKKLEDKLRVDKEQLQRNLRSDLTTLELRITDQQRQQDEKALAWSWQQQQQQHQQQQLQLQQQQLLVQQQSQQQQPHFMHQLHGQESQPNQEQPYMQQHSILYDPPPYVYPLGYQESMVYQQRLQAYHDQQNFSPAETHNAAIDMQRRLILPPPPPYCQSNSRISTEASSTARKVRHRRPTVDQRSDPYAAPTRGPLPPAAEVMRFQENPQIVPPTAQTHEPSSRNEQIGITSIMTNYVANFMNMRAER